MNYDKAIKFIQSNAQLGDIIFLGSNDLIGKLIRFAQKEQTSDGKPSLWSHACLFIDENTVIESTIGFEPYRNGSRWDNGVQYYSLENRIQVSGYNCSLVKLPLNKKQRSQIKSKAEDLYNEGITYPVIGLLGSLLTYTLFPKWKNNPLDNENRSLYCSAFVAKVYSTINIKFSNVYDVDNISPQILWNGVTTISRVKIYNLIRNGQEVIEQS
jgi:hypothetical protein